MPLSMRFAPLATATLVAAVFVLAFAAAPAAAHAQLVSSSPGAGETLAEAPSELRLVFSERLVPQATTVDVLDANGRLVIAGGGSVDPSDPFLLTVALPTLATGGYTVEWRNVSADDGHGAQGFYTFGIGTAMPDGGQGEGSGDIHSGHDTSEAALETIGRSLSELGALLAVGGVIVGYAVVRPVRRGLIGPLGRLLGLLVVGSGVGATLVAFTGASTSGIPLNEYVSATRPGVLLLARALLGIAGGAIVVLAASRQPRLGLAAAAVAAGAVVVLLVASGHAGAYASPIPAVVGVVHVAAAGVWFAGVALVAWLGLRGRRREASRATLGAAIPRFSALALVSAAIFSLTGIYFAWIQTGVVIDLESSYGRLVIVKSALVLAALALGALTYLRVRGRSGRAIGRRASIETALAFGVVVVTALLASGSPPAGSRPILITKAFSSAPSQLSAELGILPGRSGTNRLTVQLDERLAEDESLNLAIQRLDVDVGETRYAMQLRDSARTQWSADTTLIGDAAQWEATVVATGADEREFARDRFTFALSASGLVAGRATPAIDPAVVLGLAALAVAVLAVAYALGGGAPPNTEPTTGRRALLVGGVIGGPIAVLLILAGMQP